MKEAISYFGICSSLGYTIFVRHNRQYT